MTLDRVNVCLGHSRPMHLVPVPINVRCYSNSNPIVRRSEVTLRATNGHRPATRQNGRNASKADMTSAKAFSCRR